ncbi:MAG: PDZ domain-containing protein, partial [Verrucomicrobia bacterium]|nr:PDZ domain-containing protein [Verrucomicrobiota bacterium]
MKRMLGIALAGLAMASGAWAKDVAYLGVATEPLDPMTGRHLGLGEGIGLAVAYLDAAGVLTGKVEEGDILHKFNDQLLVSPEQLAILVRREAPGAKASVTVLRSGKSETVEVKLGAIDRAKIQPVRPQPGWNGGWGPNVFPMPDPGRPGPDLREWMNDHRRQMRPWHGDRPDAQAEDDAPDEPAAKPGRPRAEVHSSSTSIVSETRDGVTVTLTHRDGAKSAKIEKDGKVVFDGPINNEKDLGKV